MVSAMPPETTSMPLAGAKAPAYAFYVVGVLLLAYILSFMDRTVLSLLIDPIRSDLGLSDTSIGVLIGFGFVLIYSTAGLALGRLADSGDRRMLIAVGMLVWSLATAASAFTVGFISLLAARLMVGVGEAALSPASYSLIASYFPKHRLGLATSIYALGTVLGSGVASSLIGGVARLSAASHSLIPIDAGTSGWRVIFLIVGVLGLPFVALTLTIREPRRSRNPGSSSVTVHVPARALSDALRELRKHAALYAGIMVGYAIMTIASFTAVLWGPTYFIRLHGFTTGSIGSFFGLVMGVGGTAGVLTGGVMTDRLTRRGIIDAPPRVVIGSLMIQALLFPLAYLARDGSTAEGLFAAGMFFMAFQGGLQGATIAMLAADEMRGFAMSLYLLTANIIGMGCGPLLVAVLTDRIFHDSAAVGKSLAIVAGASSIVAIVILAATLPAFRRYVRRASHANDAAVPGDPSMLTGRASI
jgi:MFS family permease